MPDIIDTAINAGSFNTLVTAITTAGLDTALKGDGPFTVFAPTDEAFSKLPSGAVEELLQDVIKLRKVLEYHVVTGKINATDLVQLQKLTTSEGKDIKVNAENNLKVNDAYIVSSDVEADKVLSMSLIMCYSLNNSIQTLAFIKILNSERFSI